MIARMLGIVGLLLTFPMTAQAEEAVDYLTEIKPLLKSRCYACHGALKQESGLRLDTGKLLHQGGDLGESIVPGKPEESLLIDALLGRNGMTSMPKDAAPLKEQEIALFTTWVKQGAKVPEEEQAEKDPRQHWAFIAPVRPEIPQLKNLPQPEHPLDAFLLVRLEAENLTLTSPAAKHQLLRRVYLDLIGLPPTPDQLQAFLEDTSPDAYEKVVDQLLESPHYGERWGRHWMDVWRYSDWYGYGNELRNSARHMWQYRDWIVESLNADKPYSRMVQEMLAADEIAPTDQDALRATGYLARSYFIFNRNTWLEDTVEHTSKAFLGLTINCARCHDHMYDPISQQDYYQFRAFFEPHEVRTDRTPGEPNLDKNGIPRVYDAKPQEPTWLFVRGDDKNPDKSQPMLPAVPDFVSAQPMTIMQIDLPPEAWYPGLKEFVQQETLQSAQQELAQRQRELDQLQQKISSTSEGETPADEMLQLELQSAERHRLAAKAKLEATQARIQADNAKYGKSEGNPEELAKTASTAEVQAALVQAQAAMLSAQWKLKQAQAALKPEDKKTEQAVQEAEKQLKQAEERLKQAEQKQPDGHYQPLSPIYPRTSTGRRLALANWIADTNNPLTARVAVNHIWMRHFGNPLVSSTFDLGLNGTEPTHPELLDWLAVEFMEHNWSMKHLHRLMVTSQAYRRQSSSLGQDANFQRDPENRFYWRMNSRRMEAEAVRDALLVIGGSLDRTFGGPELSEDAGMTSSRRSIYYRHAPEKIMTFLDVFDVASPRECYRRAETIVPQQSLALMNSQLSLEQARKLEDRLTQEVGSANDEPTAENYIKSLYFTVLCRMPDETELALCSEFLKRQTARFSEPLTPLNGGPKSRIPPAKEPHLRARENLAHVLLNHNEFLMIR